MNKYNPQTGELITLASGTRTWIGTKAQYDAQKTAGTLPRNCIIIITDDETEMDTMPTAGSPVAVTSDGIYQTLNSITQYTSQVNLPTGWTTGPSGLACFKKNGLMFVYGSMYTTGSGIASDARLTCENFFPADCAPSYQSAFVFGGSPLLGERLGYTVTGYVSGGGIRTLYIDNRSGSTLKQIYFNIVTIPK